MYVLQDGKLYSQLGDKELVGVEIYSDKVLTVDGTQTSLGANYQLLTKHEVFHKFQIDQSPYIFPQVKKEVKTEEVKKEVVENEPVNTVQKPTRKSTRK